MSNKIKPMLAVEADLDNLTYPIYADIKWDGCFSAGTQVWTEKGLMRIDHIVNNKLKIKVASFNEDSGVIEFKKITGWFDNGLKQSDSWFTFGSNLITSNHKVFSNGVWTPAENYRDGGMFVNPKIGGALTGFLLGDGIAVIDKRYPKLSWRVFWSNSVKDEGYGDFKSNLLSDLFSGRKITKKNKVSGYGKPVVHYSTPSCTNLPFDVSKFYTTDSSDVNFAKRKLDLTLEDLSCFDDLSLAIWYFDDGTIQYNNGNINTPRISFSVPRYSDKTFETFKMLFRKNYNVEPTITRRGKDATMTFDTPSSWYLLSIIARVAGSGCSRKIPEVFKLGCTESIEMFVKDIKLVGKRMVKHGRSYRAYDIEVEDNHNYFANGMLVHNCRALVIDGVVYSRSMKPIRSRQVQELFGKPEYNGFDGELIVGNPFAKDVFQRTTSSVMSEDKPDSVVFYVFDLWDMPDQEFRTRRLHLQMKMKQYGWDNPLCSPAPRLCENKEEVLDELAKIERVGGEGLILRSPYSGYKYGRSTQKQGWLLKVKFFEDDEFEVIGFEERMHNTNEAKKNELGHTERSSAKEGLVPMDTLGSLVLKYGDTSFKCGTGFSDELRKEIWDNKERYLGKLAKIRYMSVGSKTLPRIPSFKGFRDREDL